MAFESHDYPIFKVTVKTEIEPKKNDISRDVDRALIEKGPNNKKKTGMESNISIRIIVNPAEMPICFEKTLFMYEHGSFSTLLMGRHFR